ncbi:MAG TPA: hypothetical protein VIB49_02875 [Thermoplasmata archaeon]|jgi:hypothetical protein
MKLFSRKGPPRPKSHSAAIRPESVRLLTEYVLHMSITCLANEDIEPLYQDYIRDPRLGKVEKEELTQAYLTLHLRAAQAAANG